MSISDDDTAKTNMYCLFQAIVQFSPLVYNTMTEAYNHSISRHIVISGLVM